MEVENGKTVSFHYVGTLDNGDEFDNSYDRGEPLTGLVGEGHLIPGFESALIGMQAGDKKSVLIESKNAYGEYDSKAIQQVPVASFPEDFVAREGEIVQGQGANGQVFNATILEANDDEVTLDFNHPLAGQNLNFEIEVVAVAETS